MIKRMAGVVLTASMAATASAASAAAAPAAQCKARAEAALQAFTQGRFGEVAVHFAPGVAGKAGADAMQGAMQQLEAAHGAFRGLGALAPRTVQGRSMLAAPIEFARGRQDVLVACDAENRIETFLFVPASPMAAASAGRADAASALAKLLAVTAAHERPPQAQAAARVESDGVRVQPLDVPSPLGPLHGALTLPAGKGPFPAVVLVQGSGSSDMDETIGPNRPFRDIADGLAKAGVASLRYDKRAFVYPQQVAADAKLTVDDEVTDDALAAAQLLAKQQQVDPRRMFVLGLSEGGMLAPRIGQRDPRLAGIIMLAAPARQLLEVSAEQVRGLAAKHGEPKAEVDANLEAIAAERQLLDKADPQHPPAGSFGGAPQSWWLSLHDYDQVAAAKALSMPILILQGGSDFQVSPAKDYEAWKHALAGKPDVTFHLYPGLSHLFMPAGKTLTIADYAKPAHVDPAVIRDIADWIETRPRA